MKKRLLIKFLSVAISCTIIFSVACRRTEDNSKSDDAQTNDVEILDTNISLCENGVSSYKIIVPQTRTPVIDYIAEETSNFIMQSTGAEIPVEVDTGNYPVDSKLISLGETSAFKQANISVDKKGLGRDGFKIERKENSVYICGGEDFGTAFGCYEFLEHEIGFEAYAEDEVYLEQKTTLKLKDFHMQEIPDFATRTCGGVFQREILSGFRLRLLTDYYFMPQSLNGGLQDEWIPAPDHTLRKIVTYQEYGAKYPEWFISGEELSGQLCLTNEEMLVTFIAKLKDLIESKPNGKHIAITQQDGTGWCDCVKCKNEVAKYNFSGYYVRFVNKIIDGFLYEKDGETVEVEGVDAWVNETYPNRDLDYVMFAYGDTLDAPTTDDGTLYDKSCAPHEKLCVRIAISDSCFYHRLDDEKCVTNLKANRAMNNWRKICNKFMVWDYAANYVDYMQFYNDYNSFKPNLLRYKEMGAVHLYKEFASTNVYPFANMRTYIYGKLSWDLDENISDLINEFMTQYYKDAAPYVKEYFDFIINYWAAHDAELGHNFHANNATGKGIDDWPRNIVDKSLALLDKALVAANNMQDKKLGEIVYKRVLEEKLSMATQKLENYSAYDYNQDEYATYVASYKKMVEDTEAIEYSQYKTFAEFLKTY